MLAHTSTSSRKMSLSSEYLPRRTPSYSPLTNPGIHKTTIDRSPKLGPKIRLPRSFTKSRRNTTQMYEAKIAELLEENNVLKQWWAIDMQDRPKIQEHNPSHQWRKGEVWFREPRRQASALIEQSFLRPEFDEMIEMRNESHRRTECELAAAKVELDEVNAARRQDLEMLGEVMALKEREYQQYESHNEQLNEQLDQLEAEKDELTKRLQDLESVRGLKELEQKLQTAEGALAAASEKLEVAQQDLTLRRIMGALNGRRLR